MKTFMKQRGHRFVQIWRGAIQRFTPQGVTLSMAYLLTLPFVIDVNLSLVYQFFGLSLALLGFSLAWVFAARIRGRGFSLSRSLPAFVTAGEPFTYECRLTNLTSRNQADLVLLDRVDDLRTRLSRPLLRDALPPGVQHRTRIQALAPNRGVLRFSGMSVGIPDPLGLFRSFFRIQALDSLHVFPRRYPVPDLKLMGRSAAPLPDEARPMQRHDSGDSQEFAYLREYRHGDPIRRIHWKGWPRYGRPVVKEFLDEQRGRYALFLDCSEPDLKNGPLGKARSGERGALTRQVFEAAVSVAASWAAANWPDETPLDLMAVGDERISPRYVTGPARTLVFLQALAAARICPPASFEPFRAMVLAESALFTGVILVLPAPDSRRLGLVEELRARNLDVKALAVTWDKDEQDIPLCHTVRPASIAEDLAWT